MEFVTTSPLDQSFNSLPQSSDFSLPFDRTQPRTAPRSVKSAPPGDSDFSHGRRRSACFRDDKSAMPRVTDAELSNEAGHYSTTSWCRRKILTSPLLKAVFRWHDFLSRFCRFRGTTPIARQESKWMGVGPTSRPSSMFSNSESTHTQSLHTIEYQAASGRLTATRCADGALIESVRKILTELLSQSDTSKSKRVFVCFLDFTLACGAWVLLLSSFCPTCLADACAACRRWDLHVEGLCVLSVTNVHASTHTSHKLVHNRHMLAAMSRPFPTFPA